MYVNLSTNFKKPAFIDSYVKAPVSWLAAWLGESRLRFAAVASAWLLLVYNLRFWSESLTAVGGWSGRGVLFLGALAVILLIVQAWLLLLLPGRRLPVYVVAALLAAAAILAYFESAYVVYFDKVMVRNVFETDAAETQALLTPKLFAYVALLGVLPAALVSRVTLPRETWRHRLKAGAVALVGGFVLIAALALAFSANLASFLREHKPLRYLLNPAAFVYGAVANAIGETDTPRKVAYIEGPVEKLEPAAASTKPLLVLLVVGETARAANFQLGGYARPTNPQLEGVDGLVYFTDARSCGTSTATSIPCMFSHLGRTHFDLDEAPAQSNLLDAAVRGDVRVEWRDNNSGCKHVCERVGMIDVKKEVPACANGECFDEAMVSGLRDELLGDRRNTLIVLHTAGSHGPAYFERYGPEFETFKPACRSPDLAKCDRQSIVNAYDNTIVHTDHVLFEQIGLLESLEGEYDSALVYISDHGESLGEKGLYLHAAPYFMAPDEQTHVPLLMWFSDGYRKRAGIDPSCVSARATQPASHDNLYHTVLGALALRSGAYRPDEDLLAGCRAGW
jgi:lipid A ethanolaminephosphotransferase